MPKVIFTFDPKKEYEYIRLFEEHFGEVPLPKALRKILSDKKKAIEYIEKTYDRKKLDVFERSWKKIETDYFKSVERITGYHWGRRSYTVLLTRYMHGFCNPLIANAKEVTCQQNTQGIARDYVVAHELLHSHYFRIVADKKDSKALFSTELNENFNILALCFSDMRGLFVKPQNEWIIKYFVNSHQSAAKYFDVLLPLWEDRKSFEDYVQKSTRVLKKKV